MSDKNADKMHNNFKYRNNRNTWVLIGVLLFVLSNFITYVLSTRLPIKGTRRISEQTYEKIIDFKKLFVVNENLKAFYDGKIDKKTLVDGAIKGMTESLKDPYTVYMNENEYKQFNTQTEGDYVGLGLIIGVKNNKVIVVSTFDDSPAKKSGILSGDIIEKIDGQLIIGKEYSKAVEMMKGRKGSYTTLNILRENKGSFDVKVKRDTIVLKSVKGQMLDNKIGYVQISVFDEHTSDQFNEEVNKLRKDGMRGILIDLRQNPGGWLSKSIEVTSEFIPKGKVIVSTIDKNNNKEEYKSIGGKLIGMPLVVLIDGGTASASEIFSGAIRDYKVGTLVGENTFGKGIVQSVLSDRKFGFGDGTALKVTTSKYYTPKGENIHHKGIKPDFEVKYPKELMKKPYNRNTDSQFKKALELLNSKIN